MDATHSLFSAKTFVRAEGALKGRGSCRYFDNIIVVSIIITVVNICFYSYYCNMIISIITIRPRLTTTEALIRPSESCERGRSSCWCRTHADSS